MNIRDKHSREKPVSTTLFFEGQEGKTTAMQLLKDQELKSHISKVPALLICIAGETVFENEKGFKTILQNGDFVDIEPNVRHWLVSHTDSQLLLLK